MISFYDGTGAGRHLIYDDFGPTSGTSATIGDLVIQTATSANPTGALWINGTVQIGDARPVTSDYSGFKLSVDGTMIAKECYIQVDDWADNVFDENYSLKDLPSLKNYVFTNRHLPEIPNECQVLEKGVAIGDMNKLLLKKIEELTLYVIKLEEENTEIKLSILKLKN